VFVFYLIIITFSSIFCEQILSAHVGFDTFLQSKKTQDERKKTKHSGITVCIFRIELALFK